MIGFEDAAERRGFWRGVAVGLTASAVVASCMTPPKARAQSADTGSAVATATASDGSVITLHTGRGPCVGEARLAVWTAPPGKIISEPVPGCWLLTSGVVTISFLDGERADIPARLLVKASSL